MILVGRQRLKAFIEKHPDAGSRLENWLAEVKDANWTKPQEVKDRYRSASFLRDNTVIFNVKGNLYRMEVQVAYKTGRIIVKRIGIHSEYDQWRR